MESPWKTMSSKQIYKNPWIELQEDQVIRPDGKPGTYSVLNLRDSIFIIALDSDKKVYIQKQYRYPRQRWEWELPAGGTDYEGHDPLEAAKMELREETGLEADAWECIGELRSSVTGIMSDMVYTYLARDLRSVGGTTHVEEGIAEVKKVSIDELFALVADGTIADGQDVASLMYFRLWLDKNTI